jgi:hypothetical protein
MNASDFEYRHQTLVHQLIVGAAFLTYLIDREDVVWRFVKDSATPHGRERLIFIIATLLIALGAAISTRARVHGTPKRSVGTEPHIFRSHPRYLGELCYAIGLGSLVPLAGFVVLVGGEALRVFRLLRRDAQNSLEPRLSAPRSLALPGAEETNPSWRKAFRQEAVKWGILIAMIVFVITLKDGYAEFLVVASFLVGTSFNVPIVGHSTRAGRSI